MAAKSATGNDRARMQRLERVRLAILQLRDRRLIEESLLRIQFSSTIYKSFKHIFHFLFSHGVLGFWGFGVLGW